MNDEKTADIPDSGENLPSFRYLLPQSTKEAFGDFEVVTTQD